MNILLKIFRVSRLAIPGVLLAVMAVAGDEDSSGSREEQGGEADEYFQLENCISRSAIRRTEIIDDRTIVFYMSQQRIYLNQLPNRCAGLRSARAFAYRTTGSQLCNVDMIKVVRTMGGRPDTGPSCGLGKFRPVTKEEIAMIKDQDTGIPPEESGQADDSGDSAPEDSADAD